MRRIHISIIIGIGIFLCFSILLALSRTTDASTITVRAGGGADYLKIQDAINNSNVGDSIYVYNGTYNEHLIINKTLNLLGENQYTTIIEGDFFIQKDIVNITADSVNFSNFHVKGARNMKYAVLVSGTNNVSVNNNIMSENFWGVSFVESHYNVLYNNTFFDNDGGAITLNFCKWSKIENNTINENYGIYNMWSNHTIIHYNHLIDSWTGINIYGSSNLSIQYNNIHLNSTIASGIETTQAGGSYDIIIQNNNITGCDHGLWLLGRYYIIQFNHIYNNTDGVVIASDDTIFNFNNISYNDRRGLSIIDRAKNLTIQNNNICNNNKYGVYIYSHNVVINFNNISSNGEGIYVDYSDWVLIDNNTIVDNMQAGIYSYGCNNNTIQFNQISDNGNGINITYSEHILIIYNEIHRNQEIGIHIKGNYSKNFGHNITRNNVERNGKYGIYLPNTAHDNWIFLNNIINNSISALSYEEKNNWNNSIFGNFWSDYNGTDSDNDGIGDTFFIIPVEGHDYRPLLNYINSAGRNPFNTPPYATIKVIPENGSQNTTFILDASGSLDYEDDKLELRVSWDWENDGEWDTDWDYIKIAIRQYVIPGDYFVKLGVKDSEEYIDEIIVKIEVFLDSDLDGYKDAIDDFPYDSTQWKDTDGDGYGDNLTGNNPDAFPNDSGEWMDKDGDGIGDNTDLDNDNDGLPDIWEIDYFGNLSYNSGDDPDSDGFTNIQEYQEGTNPIDAKDPLGPEGSHDGESLFSQIWWILAIIGLICVVILIIFIYIRKLSNDNLGE